jgi:hypothetical protein
MNRKLFSLFLVLLTFAACSSTKNLKDNQYFLEKNLVKVEDIRSDRFSDLYYLIRPQTNTKFMGIINIKTAIYASHLAQIDSITGEVKDSKINRWMRQSLGEEPILLDSNQIDNSMEQIRISMKKMGYFNSKTLPEVQFSGKNKKKAKVIYHVFANEPYFVRDIKYDVSIPEYKKIIFLDSTNNLIKKGMQYDEDIVYQERIRIANLIRDNGYYHVPNSALTVEVDTFLSGQFLTKDHHRTVSIDILVNYDNLKDESLKQLSRYKYKFDKVFIYTNYDIKFDTAASFDTIPFFSFRNKKDSTTYFFITPKKATKSSKKNNYIKDYNYKTITDILYTKKGWLYTQSSYTKSYRRLDDLKNFSIINIDITEDIARRDSIKKQGVLNVQYKLTRNKIHSIAPKFEVRTDKTNLAFTYTNKNIFKGAEFLNVNVYGSLFYYDWITNKKETTLYEELGGSVSLDFPKLFIFKQTQKIEAIRYSTSIRFGANYSWLYYRLLLNTSLTYNWSPNLYINHSISPIDISTIDTSRNTVRTIQDYPSDYRLKFSKKILVSLKYCFDYLIPTKNKAHKLRLTFNLESSGLTISGLNALANMGAGEDKTWKIAGYNYSTYEMAELTLRYYYTINKNNSIASRLNVGAAIPLINSTVIPFEKSFYLGGANSMRAWSFRSLGPGSFYSTDNIERTGDLKLEANFEYRGTIYKAIKYGLFVDMGNIWMTREYADMPGVEFKFNRFYKEIAVGAGAGIRLDFSFFLIRLDYGIPIYDPSKPVNNYWINSSWVTKTNGTRLWNWAQGFQFAIDHAF